MCNCTVCNPDGAVNTSADFIGNMNPFRYRGYYWDRDLQLYHLQTRYYDPAIGRFISPDSYEYLDPKSFGGLNLYCYCYNNPIMYADPSGHVPEWLSDIGRFIGGLLISAASIALMVATISSGGLLCLLPGYGTLLQAELSLLMYGGFMMASSWDPSIQSDMETIKWNPFNSNPDMSNVNKVSFYKGEAVILQNFAESSFSYGIMFLHKDQYKDQNTVNHEWGHFAQMLILGPGVFTVFAAAPSLIYNLWGDYQDYNNGDIRSKLYYSKVWERTADWLGGVDRKDYYDFWNIRNFIFW